MNAALRGLKVSGGSTVEGLDPADVWAFVVPENRFRTYGCHSEPRVSEAPAHR